MCRVCGDSLLNCACGGGRYRLTVDNGYGVDVTEYTTRDEAEKDAERAMRTQDEGMGVCFEIEEV